MSFYNLASAAIEVFVLSVLIAVVVGSYLYPTIIAFRRRRLRGLVFAVNLLLGWTLIGLFIAWLMATSGIDARSREGDAFDARSTADR